MTFVKILYVTLTKKIDLFFSNDSDIPRDFLTTALEFKNLNNNLKMLYDSNAFTSDGKTAVKNIQIRYELSEKKIGCFFFN